MVNGDHNVDLDGMLLLGLGQDADHDADELTAVEAADGERDGSSWGTKRGPRGQGVFPENCGGTGDATARFRWVTLRDI